MSRFENGKTYKLSKDGREFDVLVRFAGGPTEFADVTFWPGTKHEVVVGGHYLASYKIVLPEKTYAEILDELPIGGRFKFYGGLNYIKVEQGGFVAENPVIDGGKARVYPTGNFATTEPSENIEVLPHGN